MAFPHDLAESSSFLLSKLYPHSLVHYSPPHFLLAIRAIPFLRRPMRTLCFLADNDLGPALALLPPDILLPDKWCFTFSGAELVVGIRMLPTLGLLSCLAAFRWSDMSGHSEYNKSKDPVELFMLSQPFESMLAMYTFTSPICDFRIPANLIPRPTVLILGSNNVRVT